MDSGRWEDTPGELRKFGRSEGQFRFNEQIIDATHDLVCPYKPNLAFYEGNPQGEEALQKTDDYLHLRYPQIPVIGDNKLGDIGNTNLEYVRKIFYRYEFDAITVHPYLGKEALKPFLDQKDKGIIVLVRTSNPGAGEFQDLVVRLKREGGKSALNIPLYQHVAYRVTTNWNEHGNCGLVVGATYPEELAQVRTIAGDMPILIPGIGAQGGEVEETVKAGKDSRGWGMIINSSRGIIFASKGDDFAEAARKATESLREEINRYR